MVGSLDVEVTKARCERGAAALLGFDELGVLGGRRFEAALNCGYLRRGTDDDELVAAIAQADATASLFNLLLSGTGDCHHRRTLSVADQTISAGCTRDSGTDELRQGDDLAGCGAAGGNKRAQGALGMTNDRDRLRDVEPLGSKRFKHTNLGGDDARGRDSRIRQVNARRVRCCCPLERGKAVREGGGEIVCEWLEDLFRLLQVPGKAGACACGDGCLQIGKPGIALS